MLEVGEQLRLGVVAAHQVAAEHDPVVPRQHGERVDCEDISRGYRADPALAGQGFERVTLSCGVVLVLALAALAHKGVTAACLNGAWIPSMAEELATEANTLRRRAAGSRR